MSLIVSLRIPDGIVVAADSLSTSRNLVEVIPQRIQMECPHCKNQITSPEVRLPPFSVPFSASSYTQKLFPFFDRYAISFYGQGIINQKSMFYHIRDFERTHQNQGKSKDKALKDCVDLIIKYLEGELLAQYTDYRENAPDNWRPIGLHINGFEKVNKKYVGVTYRVGIGKVNQIDRVIDIGCTVGGDIKVVTKLWEIGKEDQQRQFKYPLFSLQDAIELSKFLIETTSIFQKFSNEVQTVGGETDIALLTPFDGFTWIKRKELMEVLEKNGKSLD